MLNGREVRLSNVSFSDTVDYLKRRISTEIGPKCNTSHWVERSEEWLPERQKLWAYGCYLENGRTLSDYHLKSGDPIHLTLRTEGVHNF